MVVHYTKKHGLAHHLRWMHLLTDTRMNCGDRFEWELNDEIFAALDNPRL